MARRPAPGAAAGARAGGRPGVDVTVVTGRDTLLAERLARRRRRRRAGAAGRAGLDPRACCCRCCARLDRGTIVHAHDSHAHATRRRRRAMARQRRSSSRGARSQPLRHPERYRRARGGDRDLARRRGRASRDAGVDRRAHPRHPRRRATHRRLRRRRGAGMPADDRLRRGAAAREGHRRAARTPPPRARRRVPRPAGSCSAKGPERGAARGAARPRCGLRDIVALAGFVADPQPCSPARRSRCSPRGARRWARRCWMRWRSASRSSPRDVGGLPEALRAGRRRAGAADAPAELAAAVQRLLSDDVHRLQLARAARDAAPNFGITRMVERTLDVYRSIDTQPGTR